MRDPLLIKVGPRSCRYNSSHPGGDRGVWMWTTRKLLKLLENPVASVSSDPSRLEDSKGLQFLHRVAGVDRDAGSYLDGVSVRSPWLQ